MGKYGFIENSYNLKKTIEIGKVISSKKYLLFSEMFIKQKCPYV